jgi:hypothetical protein
MFRFGIIPSGYNSMKLAFPILLCTQLAMCAVCVSAQEGEVVRGTVIMAIGNSNGIVVLTDSKQTVLGPSGFRPLGEPAQKLFKLDESTICAIAGIGAIGVQGFPEFFTYTGGIVTEYGKQIRPYDGKLPIARKITGLSGLLQNHFSLLADIKDIVEPFPYQYGVEIILAGYDIDGKLKIETVDLLGVKGANSEGHPYWGFREASSEIVVNDSLKYSVRGIKSVGDFVLGEASRYSRDQEISDIGWTTAKDNGAFVNLQQILEISRYVKARTAEAYPMFVGGPDQVAILAGGKAQIIDQPNFPELRAPTPLAVIANSNIADRTATRGNIYCVWLGSFTSLNNIDLRHNIFIDSEIRDSFVEYDGGFYFLSNTRIVNSVLLLGPHALPSSREVKELLDAYPWVKDNGRVPFP